MNEDRNNDAIPWDTDDAIVPPLAGRDPVVAAPPDEDDADAAPSPEMLLLGDAEQDADFEMALPPPEGFSDDDFEKEDEPFDRADAQKLGILGGKGVGKSYLFQAMVYRTFAGRQSGALTYYLERDSMRLFMAAGAESGV